MLAVWLELIVMMTDHCSSWTLPYRGRITHIAFALFCVKIAMTRYKYWCYLPMVLLGILGCYSYFTCDDEYIIRVLIFIFASVDIDINELLKCILWVSIIGSGVIIFLAITGICGNIADTRDFGRGAIESRYCLGFNHANNLHDMYWYVVCIYALKHRMNYKWYEYASMTVINIIIYMFSSSRTGVVITQLLIVLLAIGQLFPWIKKSFFSYGLGCILIVGLYKLTRYAARFGFTNENEAFMSKMDGLLNGRLEMVAEYAGFREWMLFPPYRNAIPVDNGFAKLIYSYGLVVCFVLFAIFSMSYLYLYFKKEYTIGLILTCAIVVFFMESTFILNVSILCNMMLIAVVCTLNVDASLFIKDNI